MAEIKKKPQEESKATPPPQNLPILTVDKYDTPQIAVHEEKEIAWHEIKNAHITRRPLSGTLFGVEKTPNDNELLGVVFYKGYKISIPAREIIQPNGNSNNERMEKIISSMIGAEISFLILGINNTEKTVIASRLEASKHNIQTFYFDKNSRGQYKIYEGSIVEAKIIGVSQVTVRVEVFGAECSIQLNELFWDFHADARDEFNIGDRVMVKITSLKGRDTDTEPFSITASVRQAKDNPQIQLISTIRKSGQYVGKIIEVRNGTYIVKLVNGLSVFVHSSHCRKTPMKDDTVKVTIKHINNDNHTVVGDITNIIKSGSKW